MSAPAPSFDDKMAALRQAFTARASAEADELDELVASLEAGGSAEKLERVRSIAHRVAGSAGIFGLADLTDPAVAVEECIIGQHEDAEIHEKTHALISQMRRSLDGNTDADG